MEMTLALIKPDAIQHADAIMDAATDNGFVILRKRRVRLTPEQTSELFMEHYGKRFFPHLIAVISSGPVIAMVLAKEGAIQAWRDFMGPTVPARAQETHPHSLRARFGTDPSRNAVHGSDSTVNASREIKFFFPDVVVEEPANIQTAKDYLEKNVNPTLIRGLTALCKVKPADPMRWLADWMEEHNPNKPQVIEPQE